MLFSVCHIPCRLNSLVSVCSHSVRRYALKTLSYYEVLGVSGNASRKEIKAAFIEKSKKLHPDRNRNDPKTHDKFVQLNEAYTTLSDPGLKSLYDARKGFMGNRRTAYNYKNYRAPHVHRRPSYESQDYYGYQYHRTQGDYEGEQKTEDKIRETGLSMFIFMLGAYFLFYISERLFKKSNTIDVNLATWIKNHHEAKAFRDHMYVQRVLTDYFDTLDPKSQQTLRSIPRTTRYQILLEMYEEKMDMEDAQKAKEKAEKKEEEKRKCEKDSSVSEEIVDNKTTMTLNLLDLSSSRSNHKPTVDTS